MTKKKPPSPPPSATEVPKTPVAPKCVRLEAGRWYVTTHGTGECVDANPYGTQGKARFRIDVPDLGMMTVRIEDVQAETERPWKRANAVEGT